MVRVIKYIVNLPCAYMQYNRRSLNKTLLNRDRDACSDQMALTIRVPHKHNSTQLYLWSEDVFDHNHCAMQSSVKRSVARSKNAIVLLRLASGRNCVSSMV